MRRFTSITIPESVTEIGERALGYYYDTNYGVTTLDDFIIYGKKGSAAEAYAKENGFTFISDNLGDVNSDRNIDIEDAVMVINHVNGVTALTDEEISMADIDGNSEVDIEDAVAIIAHVNGVNSID